MAYIAPRSLEESGRIS